MARKQRFHWPVYIWQQVLPPIWDGLTVSLISSLIFNYLRFTVPAASYCGFVENDNPLPYTSRSYGKTPWMSFKKYTYTYVTERINRPLWLARRSVLWFKKESAMKEWIYLCTKGLIPRLVWVEFTLQKIRSHIVISSRRCFGGKIGSSPKFIPKYLTT